MKSTKWLVRMMLCSAASVSACLVPPLAGAQTSAATMVVAGASTMYPLMIDIARRFESLNGGAAVEVRSVGTGKGVAALRAGAADIAMVGRTLVDSERDLFAFPICRDAVAIVVHRSNPIKGLDSRQLARVLTGNITDWKQLGSRGGAIKIIWRAEGQAIPELLLQRLKLKPGQVRSHAVFFEDSDAVSFVANDRDAITFAALAVAERSARVGSPVRLLAYEGVVASSRTVRDHTYVMSRPLILVTRNVPTGLRKSLIDYAVSGSVADLYDKHGFVPYQD